MDVVGHDSQVIKRNRGLDADASQVPVVVWYYGGGGRSFICSRSLLKKELVEYIKKVYLKKMYGLYGGAEDADVFSRPLR